MSNAKEFEQARLSPAFRHSGKTVPNTRLSKAAMGAEGCPCSRDPCSVEHSKGSPGWCCCVRAGCAPSPAAHEPLPLLWLEILASLDSLDFFPNLWWVSHMGCGICEPQITLIWKELLGKYTDDINILSFECLHSHMPVYNTASRKIHLK